MRTIDILHQDWLDLVFEGRNKEYGAYDLRRTSARTTIYAFFIGLLFLASAIAVPAYLLRTTDAIAEAIPIPEGKVIHVDNVQIIPQIQTPPAAPAAPTADELPKQLVDPTVVEAAEADQNIATNAENQPAPPTTIDGTPGGTGIVDTGIGTVPSVSPVATPAPNGPVTTDALDKLPEYPGGIDKFRQYVANKFERPEMESAGRIRIQVYFVIEKDGSMTGIQARTTDPKLQREAIRVLKSIRHKWKPGILNGEPVATAYTMPIVILLE